MTTADFEELLKVLDVAQVDADTFTGGHPSRNPVRTFGGQMMAQAFVAASRTVPPKLPPTTLSTHFIAGGDPERDLEFKVVRLRDERRFANRRVDVMQGDTLLATALVSHLAGGRTIDDLLKGYEETVPLFVEALKPIEWRYTNDPAWVMRDKGGKLDHNRVWLKTMGAMPDDPVLHAAALVYSSDTTLLDSIITTHGLSWGHDRIFAVTMNHTVWFHRPIKFDEWVLYSTTSPVAADSRGLASGHFFDRAGQVLATVTQEGIVKHFPG
ncbi:acyl-CoA thioesterase [Mycolicibacterium mucogenicum]|uniref:acyl-CoA thioesterase n=1 Tax=Mycolicibacterium mucogenicum TaxID=56689 RepID=UPI00076AAA1B|nr:acyl-CoA thioesterase II [Mycolicibacterium mucogenicum]